MSKEKSSWYSERVEREITLVRYGLVGTPVLVFPTAAGDAEECERFLLTDALGPLMAEERIKVYSIDSVAGQAWMQEDNSVAVAARIQNRFDACIYEEVVPAIRADCEAEDISIVTAGASIGAFNALASLCRHPDVFQSAICMSGTYDLSKFLRGEPTDDLLASSPLHFLPQMPDGPELALLRERFVLLTHGEGRWEDPKQSWLVADALGERGIPNRVDPWGAEWDHDWPTWREMLPRFLDELLPQRGGDS